jgi:hypothetical protein
MKRYVLILLFTNFVASALLSGCTGGPTELNANGSAAGGTDSKTGAQSKGAVPSPTPIPSQLPPPTVDPSFKACNAYYPLTPGSHLLYRISKPSGPVGGVNIAVTAANEKGENVFTEVAKRLSVKGIGTGLETTTRKYICDGEKMQVVSNVIEVTSANGAYGRLDGKFPAASVVMMPISQLTPGSSWSYTMEADMKLPEKTDDKPQANQNKPDPKHQKFQSKQETLQLSFEVKGKGDVKVPAGTFHTIRVGVRVNGKDSEECYAPGIGLVRRTLPDGTVWELTEYNGLTPQNE